VKRFNDSLTIPLPSWIPNDAGGPGSVTKPKFSHIRSRKVGPV
jgi:hypothetical protein